MCKHILDCFAILWFGAALFMSILGISNGLLCIPLVAALIVSSILTVAIIVSFVSCKCYKPHKKECNQKSEMDRSEDVSFQQPNTFIRLTPPVDARVIIIFHIY